MFRSIVMSATIAVMAVLLVVGTIYLPITVGSYFAQAVNAGVGALMGVVAFFAMVGAISGSATYIYTSREE